MNKQVLKIAHIITVGVFLLLGAIIFAGQPGNPQNHYGIQNGNQNGNRNGNRNANGNMNGNMNSGGGSGQNGNMNHNGNMNDNANMNANGNMNGNANGNMNGNSNSTPGGTTGMMLSADDRNFMMMAAMGGMAEVEMSRLALERASSDEVKQYAQHMLDDHTKANEELMQLASSKGVTLPTSLDAKHAAKLEKLRQMSGAQFDRAYMSEAGTKAHTDMEKLFQKQATRGKDSDTKAFAAKTLPTVREHLQMARTQSNGKGSTHGNMNMSNRR